MIAVVLLITWLMGLGTFTIGPMIHLLFVVAFMMFVFALLTSRRALG